MSEVFSKAKNMLNNVSTDQWKVIGAIAAPVAVIGGIYWWAKQQPLYDPPFERPPMVVSELWVYPVKSCGGFQVKEAKVYPSGFEYDREWGVFNAIHGDTTDARGKAPQVLSIRDVPRLRLITATVDEKKRVLRLDLAEDDVVGGKIVDTLEVPLDRKEEGGRRVVDVDLWGMTGTAYDEGDHIASTLSKWLDFPVYLGRIKDQRKPEACEMDGAVATKNDRVALADFSPLHVITEESVNYVRTALPKNNINIQRFRANIVLKNIPHPDENMLKSFKLGNVDMRVAKLTGRCTVVTVDDACKKDPMFNPTAFLKKHRMVKQTHREDESKRVGEPILGLNVFPVVEDGDESWPKIVKVSDELSSVKVKKVVYENAIKF